MKLLIAAPEVRERPHSGCDMRAFHFANYFKNNWDVTINSNTGIFRPNKNSENLETVVNYERQKNSKIINLLFSEIKRVHYLYQHWDAKKWLPKLNNEYDAIILGYPMALSRNKKFTSRNIPILLDTNNNERQYYDTIGNGVKNFFARNLIKRQGFRSEKFIKANHSLVDGTISVSESDSRWVKSLCGDSKPDFIVPNVFFNFKERDFCSIEREHILFVGALYTEMNIQAVRWYINNFKDNIYKKFNIPTIFAGRNPTKEVRDLCNSEGVRLVPNPDTLDELYKKSICAIVPAISGSGSKIKISEALSYGVPVLSTSKGLVGQPSEIKNICKIADNVTEWVESVGELIDLSRNKTELELFLNRAKISITNNHFKCKMNVVEQYLLSYNA